MFPKRAFITFTNEKYMPLISKLIESVLMFSKYPIIVYTYNFTHDFNHKQVYTKRIDDDVLGIPEYIKDANDITDNIGIVTRNNFNSYYTLSRKPTILTDAMENGLVEGIFLDGDGIIAESVDSMFEYLIECENYPLVGKGLFDYMILNGKGGPNDPLELPLMNLLNVNKRSMHYVQSNFMVFNKQCRSFFDECVIVSNHPEVLKNFYNYAPWQDETIINVLLWKYNANKQLPIVHFNLSNYEELLNFYENKKCNYYVKDCPWHYIPENKNDIKFFHGCKSESELTKCIDYLNGKKNISYKSIKNDQSFKDKKIAIVTLFDHNYSDLSKISIKNKIEYVNKHNYDFIYFEDVIDKTRPPRWSKVKAVETILKDYDWVWWIDIDALIMEFDIMLESLIDDDYDMIFTSNTNSYLSNGSCFFKNSHVSFNFLMDCYDLQHDCLKNVNVNVFDHEQQSMRQLLLNVDEYKSKSKLINERCCNSFCVTENAQVLSVYPQWNSDANIYQKGDFVIHFCGRSFSERIHDFEKYEKNVNFGSKTITIIDCYATSGDKLNILRSTIDRIKKLNNDILLVTHCTIPTDILKSVTYFIYDKNNIPNEKNLNLTWYNIFEKYEIYFTHIAGVTKSFAHEFPIIRSMRNAFNFANLYDYKHFCFVEFDNYFDIDEIYKIKKLKSDLIYKNKKLMFFNVTQTDSDNKKTISYETIFFLGDVKEMCCLLNDYNYIPYDIESFNDKFTWIYPFSLEHIFVKLVENTDCLLINSHFKDFFKVETKNLSSYVDITSQIIPDCDNNFYIIVNNQNKINVKMTITFNNKVIFDNYVFGTMLPACKIDQEGEYIIDSYDMNNTLIKTDKLLYQFKYQENYKNTGYIKYK